MNNKGFTLIELLVVVLIIGILAAMALPQYFKAVERSRMSEAVTLMANIAQSQQRKYLQINKYVSNFRGLDVAPKGATGRTHCTKVGSGTVTSTYASATDCGGGNGFVLQLDGTELASGMISAHRANGESGQYRYNLHRYYGGTGVACEGINGPGAELCADFCGIETMSANEMCCTDGQVKEAMNEFTGTCGEPAAN
ncbi:MAG: prepilin-type N-terminal cleavage/methylation domain-containing protein [Elusimicrobiaceae bacterium]|nr:prepilin-type N-terminal cleavage/methylation domain-containing protein [Elusimicrobiaceae bacterium]